MILCPDMILICKSYTNTNTKDSPVVTDWQPIWVIEEIYQLGVLIRGNPPASCWFCHAKVTKVARYGDNLST